MRIVRTSLHEVIIKPDELRHTNPTGISRRLIMALIVIQACAPCQNTTTWGSRRGHDHKFHQAAGDISVSLGRWPAQTKDGVYVFSIQR